MKITQTNNQIQVSTSGAGQVIAGALMAIGALVFMFLVLVSVVKGVSTWIGLVVGLLGSALGIFIVISSKNRKILIELGGNTTVSTTKLVGGGSAQQSFPTSSIIAVRLATYVDQSGASTGGNSVGNSNNQRRSTLSLVLSNNDSVELGNSSSKGSLSVNGMNVGSLVNKAPLSKEAGELSTFLNVPLQADDTSSIAGAVQSVKKAFGQSEAQTPPTAIPTVPNVASIAPVQPVQPFVATQPQFPQQPQAPQQPATTPQPEFPQPPIAPSSPPPVNPAPPAV